MAFFGSEYHSLLGAAVPGEVIGMHRLPGKDLVAVFEAAELGYITATCGYSRMDTENEDQEKKKANRKALHGAASRALHSLLPNSS